MTTPSDNTPLQQSIALADPEEVAAAALSPDAGRNRLKCQEAVVALGRRAVASPASTVLLQDAAALIAEMLELEHSGVAEVAPDGNRLVLRLQPMQTILDAPRTVVHELSGSGEQSLAAYALETGNPVVVEDLAEEKRFRDAVLEAEGFVSGLAVPLRLDKRPFGVLLAGAGWKQSYSLDDTLFAETIAHLTTTTLARADAEQALAEQRRINSDILQTVNALILMLDARGCVLQINRAGCDMTGFTLDEIKGRHIGTVFPVREDSDLFDVIFKKLKRGETSVQYESSLLTKHGQQRHIAWSYAAVTKPDGTLQSIVATGVDVTEQREAESRAQRAEETVERVRRKMADQASGRGIAEDEAPQATWQAFVGEGVHSDRRRRPRRSYPYKQKIAPILDGKLPDLDSLVEIECKDIGPGGFSFLSATPPASDALVVALGSRSRFTYLTADVVHITRVDRDDGHKYVIGCAYTGRAQYD